jgi:hypothetical protein
MNELIETLSPQPEVRDGGYCRQCGGPLIAQDNYCGECGAGCRDLIEVVYPNNSMMSAENPEPSRSGVAASPGIQSVEGVLNNRLAVVGIIALLGPLGLPALWFSPQFSKPTKIVTTVGYVLVVTVLPIAVMWYWLDTAMRPLVDVFGN